ncbi:predicted protein [Nematostella vectensis]|uniref:C2 domain-containing protein n=1 Tax=Nematostella vectensis TaxID=45351 RepID=A7RGR5_NEMVE|nr:predicted protein [Nematostella vectensis]|eukprot:XP_001641520.1 predicted protein [Nematostella vectensis]
MVRMSDLPRRPDTGHPPDPIVELELKYGHEGKVKSESYQNTCNPHMYESFRFEVPVNDLGNQTLCFRVIDLMKTGIPEWGDEERDRVSDERVAIPRPPVSFAADELGQEGQMLLVSLAYWKPSEKLTVVVMKGKNLKFIDNSRKPDPFVKLYIMMGAKRLKKKRTLNKKRDANPVWNEAFSFNIPHRLLHRVSVMLLAKHHSERGRERLLGKLVIGATSSDETVDHWNAMCTTGKSVARWHHLIEEK